LKPELLLKRYVDIYNYCCIIS